MILNNVPLFPEIKLSATEMEVAAQSLSNPSVKKLLHKFGYDIAVEMLIYNEPGENESAEQFLRKRNLLQGQLNTLNTLLLIEEASPIPTSK